MILYNWPPLSKHHSYDYEFHSRSCDSYTNLANENNQIYVFRGLVSATYPIITTNINLTQKIFWKTLKKASNLMAFSSGARQNASVTLTSRKVMHVNTNTTAFITKSITKLSVRYGPDGVKKEWAPKGKLRMMHARN